MTDEEGPEKDGAGALVMKEACVAPVDGPEIEGVVMNGGSEVSIEVEEVVAIGPVDSIPAEEAASTALEICMAALATAAEVE